MLGGPYSAYSIKDDSGFAQAVFHGRALFLQCYAFLTGSSNTITAAMWGIVSCLNLVVNTCIPYAPLRRVLRGCHRIIRYRACLMVWPGIALACARVIIMMWAMVAALFTHNVVTASIRFLQNMFSRDLQA